mgnify:CR=1 FL=1
MNDNLSDEFLYKHIPRAEIAALESLPKENELDHIFSGRFLRKMKALLKYERRGSFGRFATQLSRVVAAVLVLVIMLNTVLVVSVEAYREKFFEIIQTVTEKYTSFFVDVDDDAPVTELVPIDPSGIPEEFELIEQFSDAISHTVIYLNEDGQEIYYEQVIITDGEHRIDTEDASVEVIEIENRTAYVVVKNGTTQIHWIDGSYKFQIISNTDYETVIAIAEKIIKNKYK